MQITNISIKGIVSTVPKNIYKNLEYTPLELNERTKLATNVGIFERRIVSTETHTSDLCAQAAEELLEKINWSKDSIDILIFVTQTPDHLIPATSHILQHRLGLRKDILSFDVNEGCSGYIYGLTLASKLLDNKTSRRCLLLVGDTVSKLIAPNDHSNTFLFGDAGTATAIEFNPELDFVSNIDTYSDGSGKDAIIIETGSICSRSFSKENYPERSSYLSLSGTDVFLFAIKEAPAAIKRFFEKYHINPDEIDGFCLHQANKMINSNIAKKISVAENKFFKSLEQYGNTSSASIPLSICNTPYSGNSSRHLLLCGFGVGLSWGVGNFLFEGNTYQISEF